MRCAPLGHGARGVGEPGVRVDLHRLRGDLLDALPAVGLAAGHVEGVDDSEWLGAAVAGSATTRQWMPYPAIMRAASAGDVLGRQVTSPTRMASWTLASAKAGPM